MFSKFSRDQAEDGVCAITSCANAVQVTLARERGGDRAGARRAAGESINKKFLREAKTEGIDTVTQPFAQMPLHGHPGRAERGR